MSFNPFEQETLQELPERDLLSMTGEYTKLDEVERRQRLSACQSTVGVGTVAQLKLRIAEYVHVRNLHGLPSKRQTINQKFGRLAHKLGLTTMHVVDDLIASGYVMELERANKRILISSKVFSYLCESFGQNFVEIEELKKRLFDAAAGLQ